MTDSEFGGWFSAERATFGDRVSGAREAAGMTQAELARRLGVRQRTLAGWEEDMSEPRANKLQMLAGMLNVSIRWLLTGEGDGLDGPPDSSGLDTDAKALLTELRQMRGDLAALAERTGRLEKRLRALLKDGE